MKSSKAGSNPKALLLGTAAGVLVMLLVGATTSTSSSNKWEYSVVQGKVIGSEETLENAINSKTAQGWDLVQASHSTDQWGFAVLRREKK